jgi:hypothetical protein
VALRNLRAMTQKTKPSWFAECGGLGLAMFRGLTLNPKSITHIRHRNHDYE